MTFHRYFKDYAISNTPDVMLVNPSTLLKLKDIYILLRCVSPIFLGDTPLCDI